jgi:hypothetical protein
MSETEKPLVFIEVNRVVSEKKLNVGVNPEVYPIHAIHTFRRWHKGKNDDYIAGEITLLVIYPDKQEPKKTAVVNDGVARETVKTFDKLKNILIAESYESFLDRFNAKVPVKRLPENG